MAEKGTEGGCRGRRVRAAAQPFGRREPPGKQADRSTFDIAFNAGDLPGKTQARQGFETQVRIEQGWRVQEGIAVQTA